MGGSHSSPGVKRPRPEEYAASVNEPVTKKLKTAEYIFDRLFQNGENSDISILAFGQEWKLHKIYLSQSPYFQSMFGGNWKEGNDSKIHLEIPDENITVESLGLVFGSLYRDEITIDSEKSVNIIAAASLLDMDPVINQCVEFMKSDIDIDTAVRYWQAAQKYSLQSLIADTFLWIVRNIMHCSSNNLLLCSINPGLMEKILRSPDLFVLQGELDIYSMVKKWLFLRLNTEIAIDEITSVKKKAEAFFIENFQENDLEFLSTTEGQIYVPIYRAMKLGDILTTISSVKMVKNDKIIPNKMIDFALANCWKTLLTIEDEYENKEPENVKLDIESFSLASQRCGRILTNDAPVSFV